LNKGTTLAETLDSWYYRKSSDSSNPNPDGVILTTNFADMLAESAPAENSILVQTLREYIGEVDNVLTDLYIQTTSYDSNGK
jgi:hypothetical protein